VPLTACSRVRNYGSSELLACSRPGIRRSTKLGGLLTVDQAFEWRLAVIEPAESRSMVILLRRLIKDEGAVTAIEYGLIAALIVVGSLIAINSVAVSLGLQTTFSKVAASL
jgi:pilus assembly protein Flp/PilA